MIGVEAAASRAVSTAARERRVVPVNVSPTIADGLAGNIDKSSVTPDIVRFTKTDMEVVGENSLRRAMRTLATNAGIYAEGSAAAGVAAVLDGSVPVDRPIVVAVTGRNITAQSFAAAITYP